MQISPVYLSVYLSALVLTYLVKATRPGGCGDFMGPTHFTHLGWMVKGQ